MGSCIGKGTVEQLIAESEIRVKEDIWQMLSTRVREPYQYITEPVPIIRR